jgi:F0F1-type ATP synthase assembly protein I
MTERPRDDETAGAYHDAQGMNQGMQVLSYLVSGIVFYGGLGWWGDHVLGTGFLLPIGIVLGAAFGIYLVLKRFGATTAPGDAASAAGSAGGATTDTRATHRTGEGTT